MMDTLWQYAFRNTRTLTLTPTISIIASGASVQEENRLIGPSILWNNTGAQPLVFRFAPSNEGRYHSKKELDVT